MYLKRSLIGIWNLTNENNPQSYKKVDLVLTHNIIHEKLGHEKSPALDKMQPRVLKELASILTKSLYYI